MSSGCLHRPPSRRGAPVPGLVRSGWAPGLDGALKRGCGDVDDDVGAGQLGERVLKFGGVVEQARAGTLADVLRAREDLGAQVFLAARPEAQVRSGDGAIEGSTV
jgi:hypothetical protein